MLFHSFQLHSYKIRLNRMWLSFIVRFILFSPCILLSLSSYNIYIFILYWFLAFSLSFYVHERKKISYKVSTKIHSLTFLFESGDNKVIFGSYAWMKRLILRLALRGIWTFHRIIFLKNIQKCCVGACGKNKSKTVTRARRQWKKI